MNVKISEKNKMKHEIKIIMTYDTENEDKAAPIFNKNIRVYIDDDVVGCIQDLKFHANHQELTPTLQIIFPEIDSLDADWAGYQFHNPSTKDESCFAKDVKRYIKKFSQISNIDIKKQEIDNGSNVVMLTEIGTDGNIDSFPMKRRHK
jgi:hypothetical protein